MAGKAENQISGKSIRYFRSNLLRWSAGNYREFPWRNTDDPYCICVAEIMLQQTFARKVAPVYEQFVKRYPSVESLRKAKIADIRKLILPLGFLFRADRLKKLARDVALDFGGIFPEDIDGLLELPGVGHYTASAIMCFAYKKEVPIIDVNVVRIYSRFFGIPADLPMSNPDKAIRAIAQKITKQGKARQLNYGLLDFAYSICSHYRPNHEICPVKRKCSYLKTI